ncbi:hypothetical protein KIN20_026301 [Parelaphostrongylus tenuis]|uniref:V-type proton ATPase subunit S1/VOA1 transmembrane domain-containing protein n=1 Tax=Parelaphostrongylus tenuis TaxID=148309 RepID=A0AAD5MWK2_PARTN|nr:hypothetical protein KIN20_026301 [Parelaphostrongylus tenuis]
MFRWKCWRMEGFVILLLSLSLPVAVVVAYDAVVFSNDQQITEHYPSIENMVSTASPGAPLVFIVNPDFTLESDLLGLPAIVKSSFYHSDRYYTDVIRVPDAVTVPSVDDFSPNASIYILEGTEWASMQRLAQELLPQMGSAYTAIITSSDAVSTRKNRVKRVVTSEMEDNASSGVQDSSEGPYINMPMNLPPYNRTEYPDVKPSSAGLGSCMLYMEGVNIVVMSKKMFATIPIRSLVNTTTWSYANGDVQCSNSSSGTYSFTVRLMLKGDVTDAKNQIKISSGKEVKFKLIFTGTTAGYWGLSDIEALKLVVEPVSGSSPSFISQPATATGKAISAASVGNVGFNSVEGFAMACSDSQAAFLKTDQDGVLIGISLYNTEVQTFGVKPDPKTKQMYFTRQVEDCIGTFSTGSWMGIVSSLILLSGFIFGFMMLNSVQTMDRFDDPKHKQIVINVRE